MRNVRSLLSANAKVVASRDIANVAIMPNTVSNSLDEFIFDALVVHIITRNVKELPYETNCTVQYSGYGYTLLSTNVFCR